MAVEAANPILMVESFHNDQVGKKKEKLKKERKIGTDCKTDI